MNYLAHLFLSDPEPEALIGNLLGDFQRGLDRTQCSAAMLAGIRLHIQIDQFTDCHPLVRHSKQQIGHRHRRFAGIMLDVLYDHYLSKHWQLYSEIALETFIQQVYAVMTEYHSLLPQRLQQAAPLIVAHDLLGSYIHLQGVDIALKRLSQRLKRVNPLGEGIEELTRHYATLEADFLAFFPDLMGYAAACRKGASEIENF